MAFESEKTHCSYATEQNLLRKTLIFVKLVFLYLRNYNLNLRIASILTFNGGLTQCVNVEVGSNYLKNRNK